MSNQSLLKHIQSACRAFEIQEISLADLQLVIEGNGQALEGISSEDAAKLHNFCNLLERLEFGCLAENQHSEGCKVVVEIRRFLAELVLR